METELKFLLTAESRRAVEHYLETAAPAFSEPEHRHEVTQYFDFADLALFKAGFSLRVRNSEGRFTQTLKSLAISGGAATTRDEREWPLARNRLDISRLAGTPAAKVFAANPEAPIGPIFTTEIDRTAYRLALEDGATAELVIDTGEIRAGERTQPVHELEIESKTGAVSPLFRFAATLHEACPLSISADSKAARGYRLAAGTAPEARKADDIDLPEDVTVGDAFRAIVNSGLGQLAANLQFCTADEAEPLHQSRIAIRRMRSALALFEPYLEPAATARFEETLKQFGQTLGAARDLDVFATETLPAAARDTRGGGWTQLIVLLAETSRRHAYVAVDRLIRSPEPTSFMLALASWSDGALWARAGQTNATLPGQSFAEVAPDMLDTLAAKAAKRGRRLEKRSLIELHALRKTLKKLRYCTEYCAGLYPRKRVGPYLDACKAVLDLLGAINDTVGTELLAHELTAGDQALIPALGLFAQITAESRAAALDKLPECWSAFAKEKAFWR
jgi:inorganic triphosphatase YgiF